MEKKNKSLWRILGMGALLIGAPGWAATNLNVFESPDLINPFGTITTIATAQTGAQHYDYFSASGHPSDINLAKLNSNIWVHENTNNGEFSFGFIFARDNYGNDANSASFRFRIIDSLTNVVVSQSDDPGEAVETAPGIFQGTFNYNDNTDGIMVSGITGTGWTIIIDSVDFGDITNWYAASGEAGFGTDLSLTLGREYRITPFDNQVSDAPVDGAVPEPSTLLLLGTGMLGLGYIGRRKKS